MEHGQKRKQHENNNTKLLFEASSWFDNFWCFVPLCLVSFGNEKESLDTDWFSAYFILDT